MDQRQVGRMWEANAPAWITLSRAGYDVYRDLVNTPAFLRMLPDVRGLEGLDLGCGEGHNTRLVADRGARMTGVDIAPRFVAAARARERSQPRDIRYGIASAVQLPFAAHAFDFVCAFMSLMDVPEADAALLEVGRVLRPGGFLQFSVPHPCSTTRHRRWVTDARGRRVALELGGYFDASPFVETWLFSAAPEPVRARHRPFRIARFPRTLGDWFNAVAHAGLMIEQVAEPRADQQTASAHPEVADTRLMPYFLHVHARLPLPAAR